MVNIVFQKSATNAVNTKSEKNMHFPEQILKPLKNSPQNLKNKKR